MKVLFDIKAKSKEDSLKYAYAFMSTKQLYIRECSFFNPRPTQFDKKHVFPRDIFYASYDEKSLPSWEEFKTNPKHLSSPAYDCTASVDKQDTKRVKCVEMEGKIELICYGNYESEAKKLLEETLEIYKTIT